MPRFHINPETGNPNKCEAMVRCPFGDLDSDHFDSKDDARRAYEKGEIEGTVPEVVKKAKSLEDQLASAKEAERNIQSRIGKMMNVQRDLIDAVASADKLLKSLKNIPFDSQEDRAAQAIVLTKIKKEAGAKKKALESDLTNLRQQASGITKKIKTLEIDSGAASVAVRTKYHATWRP